MERQTVLILDSQLHRGGILEQGLNSRGFNVFRTSRSREAAKLMQVLQPNVLILAWEGEGLKFYQERILGEPETPIRCVLMTSGPVSAQRPVDATVDMDLAANELIEEVSQKMQGLLGGGAASLSTQTSSLVTPQARPSPFHVGGGGQRATPPPKPSFPLTPLPLARNPSSLTPSAGPPPPAQQGATEAYPAFSTTPARKNDWKGSLDKLDVARLFSILMRRQASGRLTLSLQGETRHIWLHSGALRDAETNLPLLQLPELLVQEGIITHQHAQQHPDLARPRPGAKLLELGLIQANQVQSFDRMYVEQVVEACFLWEFGTFVFSPDDEPGAVQSVSELSPLIIRGVREGYSRDRLSQLLGGESRVPQWFAQRSPEEFLPLNAMEKKVLGLIDGSRSLHELWSMLDVDARIPYGLVYVLMILGYVTLQEAPTVTPAGSRDVYATNKSPSLKRYGTGETTPQVPMQSARDMYSATTQAPTPHSMPSLPTGTTTGTSETVGPAKHPPASYRTMPGSRQAARPILRTAMDLPPMQIEQARAESATQDQAAIQAVEKMFQTILAEDYFDILELDPAAGDMEIRRSYQRLKHAFSEQQFRGGLHQAAQTQLKEIQQTIQEAYDVLGDPTLRELYRQNLDAP